MGPSSPTEINPSGIQDPSLLGRDTRASTAWLGEGERRSVSEVSHSLWKPRERNQSKTKRHCPRKRERERGCSALARSSSPLVPLSSQDSSAPQKPLISDNVCWGFLFPSRTYHFEGQLHHVSYIETDPLSTSLPKSEAILLIPITRKIFMEHEYEESKFVFKSSIKSRRFLYLVAFQLMPI